MWVCEQDVQRTRQTKSSGGQKWELRWAPDLPYLFLLGQVDHRSMQTRNTLLFTQLSLSLFLSLSLSLPFFILLSLSLSLCLSLSYSLSLSLSLSLSTFLFLTLVLFLWSLPRSHSCSHQQDGVFFHLRLLQIEDLKIDYFSSPQVEKCPKWRTFTTLKLTVDAGEFHTHWLTSHNRTLMSWGKNAVLTLTVSQLFMARKEGGGGLFFQRNQALHNLKWNLPPAGVLVSN